MHGAYPGRGREAEVFCVHGAGGNVLFYRDLSEQLGNDFSFYGLQSRGLDGVSKPHSSIEDMAKTYMQGIRAVQAKGPYHLGGYCLGGIIAYEMARLFQAEGQDVALLALLDTYNFDQVEQVSTLRYLTERTSFHLGNLISIPSTQWGSYLRQKLDVAREGEFKLITKSLLKGESVEAESLQDRIHALNHEAAMRYRPRPYQGIVTNFKPKRNYSAFPDPDMGWKQLALRGVKNIELDLNPHAMLTEPFVKQLADSLSQELRVAAGRAGRAIQPGHNVRAAS